MVSVIFEVYGEQKVSKTRYSLYKLAPKRFFEMASILQMTVPERPSDPAEKTGEVTVGSGSIYLSYAQAVGFILESMKKL